MEDTEVLVRSGRSPSAPSSAPTSTTCSTKVTSPATLASPSGVHLLLQRTFDGAQAVLI